MEIKVHDFEKSVLTEHPNYYITPDGILINKNINKVKMPDLYTKKYYDKDGYIRYWVKNKEGKRKFVPAHRLVAKAFISAINNKNMVNHIDGDKQNNKVNNLEWCNNSENMIHSIRVLGNRRLGEKASRSKLKENEVLKIRELYESKWALKDISKCFKVSVSQVTRIGKRLNWSHI